MDLVWFRCDECGRLIDGDALVFTDDPDDSASRCPICGGECFAADDGGEDSPAEEPL